MVPVGAGGARCSTRWPNAARRRRVCASSKLPNSGVMPAARKGAIRAACEVSASTRTRSVSKRATRMPTSPQPTMSTRLRRKRAGKAPKGLWFEGKIGDYVRCKPQG